MLAAIAATIAALQVIRCLEDHQSATVKIEILRFGFGPFGSFHLHRCKSRYFRSMMWSTSSIHKTKNECLELPGIKGSGIEIWIKREDLLHSEVSGNKWRKLKYNILQAIDLGAEGVVTKGGAHSNHILATAAAAKAHALKALCFIRGHEVMSNPTLDRSRALGAVIIPVSREDYKKGITELLQLHSCDNENWFQVPEGGSNALGVKGCEEILSDEDKRSFDVVAVSLGTGGTALGLLRSLAHTQSLYVYPAIKGSRHRDLLESLRMSTEDPLKRLTFRTAYHEGGYAKMSPELLGFMRMMYRETGIKTDPVYTGKMLFGLYTDIVNGYFDSGTRILAIHTGGLQGIRAMEDRLGEQIF